MFAKILNRGIRLLSRYDVVNAIVNFRHVIFRLEPLVIYSKVVRLAKFLTWRRKTRLIE
jgi:hypothetical protein